MDLPFKTLYRAFECMRFVGASKSLPFIYTNHLGLFVRLYYKVDCTLLLMYLLLNVKSLLELLWWSTYKTRLQLTRTLAHRTGGVVSFLNDDVHFMALHTAHEFNQAVSRFRRSSTGRLPRILIDFGIDPIWRPNMRWEWL